VCVFVCLCVSQDRSLWDTHHPKNVYVCVCACVCACLCLCAIRRQPVCVCVRVCHKAIMCICVCECMCMCAIRRQPLGYPSSKECVCVYVCMCMCAIRRELCERIIGLAHIHMYTCTQMGNLWDTHHPKNVYVFVCHKVAAFANVSSD